MGSAERKLKPAGFPFVAMKSAFAKLPLKSSDHLVLLKRRGMAFSQAEERLAYQLFSAVGYFRLSGYCLPFHLRNPGAPSPTFKAGTCFSQVADLYRFDEALRNICGEALQRIEIALRTIVCNKLSLKHGTAHWFNIPGIFVAPKVHEVASGKDLYTRICIALECDPQTGQARPNRKLGLYPYLDNYYDKHFGPAPAWMLREVGSFGLWSTIFDKLSDNAIRQTIANEFKYPDRKPTDEKLLRGWTHSLSVFRNSCAHHHRIVHRAISFTPGTPTSAAWKSVVPPNSATIRPLLGVTALLDRNTLEGSDWLARVHALFQQYDATVDIATALGFSTAWRKDPLWHIPS